MTAVVLMLLATNPYLTEGKSYLQQLAYEKALGPLTLAAQVPGQSTSERREAYDLLARTRAALGDLPGAAAAYATLLEKDPLAPAPADAAPKIREAFRAAKAQVYPMGTVRLTAVKAAEGHLAFELFDPWAVVTRLEVHEAGGARTIARVPEASVDVRLPPGFAQAWVEAIDAAGSAVASLGSMRAPLRIGLPPVRVAAVRAAATTFSPLDRAGVLRAWRSEACTAARSGDSATASAAWRRSFLLDANVAPPEECTAAMASYQSARAFSAAHPALAVKVLGQVLPQGGAHLTLEPQNDTMGLIEQARFHVRTPAGWSETLGFTVDQPNEVLGFWVEAMGGLGVVLTVGSTADQLVPSSGSDAPVIASLTPLSLPSVMPVEKAWRAPVTLSLAGLAAISAGVGIGFGIAARADAGLLNGLSVTGLITDVTQRDAFGVAARQRSEAITANIALGLAAGIAVTSFLIFVLSAEATP